MPAANTLDRSAIPAVDPCSLCARKLLELDELKAGGDSTRRELLLLSIAPVLLSRLELSLALMSPLAQADRPEDELAESQWVLPPLASLYDVVDFKQEGALAKLLLRVKKAGPTCGIVQEFRLPMFHLNDDGEDVLCFMALDLLQEREVAWKGTPARLAAAKRRVLDVVSESAAARKC